MFIEFIIWLVVLIVTWFMMEYIPMFPAELFLAINIVLPAILCIKLFIQGWSGVSLSGDPSKDSRLVAHFRKKKNKEDIYNSEWFLRWVKPTKFDTELLKDKEWYENDIKLWNEYNLKRIEYVNKLSELLKDYPSYYNPIVYSYYICKWYENNLSKKIDREEYINQLRIKNASNDEIKSLFSEMEAEGVSLIYRPNEDYIPFGGPVWSDHPQEIDKYDLKKQIFVLNKENISKVMPDYKKYYNENKLLEVLKKMNKK